MAHFLHKLGAYAFTYKWRIVAIWLVILAALGILAMQFMKPTSTAISIPGTEAQKTLDRVGELFPDSGKGSARIVFAAPLDKDIFVYQKTIEDVSSKIKSVEGVATVISPFENTEAISKDRTIAYAQLQLTNENGAVKEKTIHNVEKIVKDARKNGLKIEMGGDIIDKTPGEILGIGEVAGVALALLVLVMTLGSLVAAGMPLLVAIVTIGVGMAGLFSLSQVIDITSTTPVLAVMLGLAVGIDYSLFIISKYRNYLLEGYTYKDAVAKAVGTAGNAVIFAAATVVIALSALTIVNIPFMSTMGLAGAGTIAVAALVAVTLIPALLGFAGDRIFIGKTKKAIAKAQKREPRASHTISHQTIWYRWGRAITARPVAILLGAIVVISIIAWPVRDLTLGLPTDEFAATSSTERKAYDLLSKGFGAGFNGPLLVVVENLPPVTEADKTAVRQSIMDTFHKQVSEETAKQKAAFEERAINISSPEEYVAFQNEIAEAEAAGAKKQEEALQKIDQQVEEYAKRYQLSKVANNIKKQYEVKQALPALATDDGTKGVIQIIPESAPSDKKTLELISDLRDPHNRKELTNSQKTTLAVTGSTALQSDINQKLSDALPVYLAVVVGLSLLLLVIAFRSILVPLKATLGFLLSVLAMFGALVAVFQWGWFGIAEAPGPIVSFIPIIAIGILFGLAMDYEFFLVSSMHETFAHTKDAKKAVIDGFGLGSKVVTAAGVIMVSVFAGFITNHDATIAAIGFGLALGIFIDAFIVRMTIVPAVMTLLGKSAWWLPKWLDRILPRVSIEGEEN